MRIAPPATEAEIQAFERRYEVEVYLEFRAYLSTVNGMLQSSNNQCDSNIFAFWQLDRIRPVADECPELQMAPKDGQCFVFADYMVWSWAYAIDLNATSADTGKVILVGGLTGQVVADSFNEFFRLYIANPPRLYATPA